ncbi:MAG: primosomal protein N' [Magnetococcales bacterium]|nr:primosomal protein N' [Magnetococcales bacterium]
MSSLYADVALPVPMRTLFTYRIPAGLAALCRPGALVQVPMGRGTRTGVVWRLTERPSWSEGEVREIADVLESTPLLSETMRRLLEWMAGYYMQPLGGVVATALPGAMGYKRSLRVVWCGEVRKGAKGGAGFLRAPESADSELHDLPKGVQAMAEAIRARKKGLGEETLARKFGRKRLRVRLKSLERAGVVTITEQWSAKHGRKKGKGDSEQGSDPLSHASEGVPEEAQHVEAIPQQLTQEQQTACDAISAALQREGQGTFLLEGVTGSGKTEVYFTVMIEALALGGQVLILVPEISLTPQLVRRYQMRFQQEVAVLHSRLNPKARFERWHAIRDGRARVVIGARSALFSPFQSLNLIVVDEEHDGSYKQEEGVRYQARDMAVVRGRMEGAVVVLGSATPTLESLHNARTGKYHSLHLTSRATGVELPPIERVDLRRDIQESRMNRDDLLGPDLRTSLSDTLERQRQAILFLNRRGFAPSLLCVRCGHMVECPNCAVALTFHKRKRRLICHYCDHHHPPMDLCPECGQMSVIPFGPGTEQLEEEVRALWPEARVARLDRDTVGADRDHLERTLEAFRTRKVDILIGTQMVAKGHHFPGVALVGVVLAETSLSMPDFRAAERTFQLVTQVAGRAGRESGSDGEESGARVLVQSLDPDHYALSAASNHDMAAFSEAESAFREMAGYPPYQRLALIRFSCLVQSQGEAFARKVSENLPGGNDLLFLGPAPSPLSRLRGRYRWQVLVKSLREGALHRTLPAVMQRLETFSGSRIRLSVDVDPHAFL